MSRSTSLFLLALLVAAAVPADAAPARTMPAPAFELSAAEKELHDRLRLQVVSGFDSARGGFFAKSGHPSESAMDLAFLDAQRDGAEAWTSRGIFTVDRMLALEDTLSGGFHPRVERSPGDSRLERSTALNARRLENLIDAWKATGDTRYWVVATRLLDYAERNLIDGRGGFVTNPVGDQDLVPEVNGVAIHAWYRWWAAARDVKRRDFARRSIDRVWQTCWDPKYGLLQRDSFGETLAWPRLADQVEMGRALVLGAHLTGRAEDLDRARQLGDVLLDGYLDRERGSFVEWIEIKKGKVSRRPGRPLRENARAALFLCELAHATQDAKYFEAARRAWRSFDAKLGSAKLDAADWALALDAAIKPSFPARPAENRTVKPSKTAKPNVPRPRSVPGEAKMGVKD